MINCNHKYESYSNKIINEKFLRIAKSSHNFISKNEKKYVERVRKTDMFDGFLFKLLYSRKNVTQDQVTSQINSFNKTSLHTTSFSRRSVDIPKSFITEYTDFMNKKIDEEFDKQTNIIPLIAIDGVKSNMYSKTKKCPQKIKNNKKGKSKTFLSMGYYNISYDEPYFMNTIDHKNERLAFDEFLVSHKVKSIYVMDNGFQDKKIFKKVDDMGHYFICRIRDDNSQFKNINDTNEIEENDIRYIHYIQNNHHFYLATNIPKHIADINILQNIYNRRWDVEEYFKYIKSNLKQDNMISHDWESIKTSISVNLFISKLIYLIFNLFIIKKIKNNKTTLNKNHLTSEFFLKFLARFIYKKKFSRHFLNTFFKEALIIITTNVGKSNKRNGAFPYTKWYIKSYYSKYVTEEG